MKELYSEEITGPSLSELEEFALWYNEKIGNYPIIVGGWAVYYYTGGLGSKDIDVVFLSDEVKHATLFTYFAAHGYAEHKKNWFETEWTKIVDKNNEIVIDAVSSKRTVVYEGTGIRVPYAWAAKHVVQHKLGNAIIYLPAIELLLTYKLSAVYGRNESFKTGLNSFYYKSKLWKDIYDVLSLAQKKVDKQGFRKFFEESGLAEHTNHLLEIIGDKTDDEIKALTLSNSFEKLKKLLLE